MYYKNARSFILKVLRIRTKLIETGESLLNPSIAENHISNIKRYLDYYPYSNDVDMAMFWRRRRHAILELIPGLKSSSAQSLLRDFNDLDGQTSLILSHSKKEHA